MRGVAGDAQFRLQMIHGLPRSSANAWMSASVTSGAVMPIHFPEVLSPLTSPGWLTPEEKCRCDWQNGHGAEPARTAARWKSGS